MRSSVTAIQEIAIAINILTSKKFYNGKSQAKRVIGLVNDGEQGISYQSDINNTNEIFKIVHISNAGDPNEQTSSITTLILTCHLLIQKHYLKGSEAL